MIGGLKFRASSFRDLTSTIEKALDQVERRGMKDALLKAATPMLKAARAGTPKRTGALRKSLAKKGKTYPGSGKAWVGIGPRKNYRGKDGSRPSKYAHLVEFGSIHTSPVPFMRRAFTSAKKEAVTIYGRELGGAINRHFARAKKKGVV